MGIDPAHLVSHNLAFNCFPQFVPQLEQRSRMQVGLSSFEQPLPTDFCGWEFNYEDEASAETYFKGNNLMQLYLRGSLYRDDFSMYISPAAFELHNDDFYMGRWFGVKHLADWIRENGIPTPNAYNTIRTDVSWIMQNRKNIFEYGQWFGISHMIAFCDDKHQEWLDYYCEDNWTIDQFASWGKKELIFVRFQDLVNFKFPDDVKKGYYDVFIYDDFEDLKPFATQWQQPNPTIYFETATTVSLRSAMQGNWKPWISYLRQEADKWDLPLEVKFTGTEISGNISLTPSHMPAWLVKRMIEQFFEYKDIPVVTSLH